MADYLPKFKPGQAITNKPSADVTGGQLVEITGPRAVAPAAANSAKWLGVASQDVTVAGGEEVGVFCGGVQRLIATGAIAAGDRVGPAAAGRVATAATSKCGTALSSGADGAAVDVNMDR